jgi:fatty acid desaturase
MHERDPSIHATLDPRAWPPILARYREPNSARSTIELVVTAVPFVILWMVLSAAVTGLACCSPCRLPASSCASS